MTASSTELFPPSPRVIYDNAPLVQVICQLRFPSLLSIESQPPVDFQENIRGQFPLLEKVDNPLPVEFPQEVAQMIRAQVSANTYQFLTEDRASTVTLTPNSLALSTAKYTRWEQFSDQLKVPLVALNDIYRPSFFTRVGLRYLDAIVRSDLGLTGTPWSKLLRPEVLGELALPQFESNLEQVVNRTLRVKIPDGSGSVLMRHGLGNINEDKELSYMIDIDFFTERKTEVANAERTLNHFNAMAGRAFRWYITDTLRDTLGPRELATVSA